jgi:hypothetical protein
MDQMATSSRKLISKLRLEDPNAPFVDATSNTPSNTLLFYRLLWHKQT